jgi:hypothetical protein
MEGACRDTFDLLSYEINWFCLAFFEMTGGSDEAFFFSDAD